MAYKKARSITPSSQNPKQERAQMPIRHHGPLAALLMILGMATRIISDSTEMSAMGILIAALLSVCLWIWGCIHLALHFRLPPAWGFLGILFIVGVAIIFCSGQARKSRIGTAKHPEESGRGDQTTGATPIVPIEWAVLFFFGAANHRAIKGHYSGNRP